MSEIKNVSGMNNINLNSRTAEMKPPAEEQTQVPQDQVSIGKPKESLARKIIRFPARAIGTVVGGVTGAVSSPLHVIPGALKGIAEANSSRKGEGGQVLFHLARWTQNLAIGAGAGMVMGGPIGAAIGAGAAVLLTGTTSFIGHKAGAYEDMVEHVEKRVGKAVEDNEGPRMKVVVQNATEGAIIGGAAAGKVGAKVGYEAGKGVVEGVFGAVEGLAEGVFEAGKSIVGEIRGK